MAAFDGAKYTGFNTQPPKGGWFMGAGWRMARYRFNTQPPKGGWNGISVLFVGVGSFNTQPPKGGWSLS